ncbi:MAG: replicative DNA helicase [Aggregatilineales bacterium]
MSHPPLTTDTPYAPYSQDAEEATIGSVLMHPPVFINLTSFLNPDDFFILRHNYIWNAIQRLSDRKDAIDPLTVSEELRRMNQLDDIGGAAYLLNLVNKVPTSVHAEVYGRLVQRTALRRKMVIAGDKLHEFARDEETSIEDAIANAEDAVFTLRGQRESEVRPLSASLSDVYDRVEYQLQNPDVPLGIPTGFHRIDDILGGLIKGDLIFFAGRPGMGKTSWMMNTAINAARAGGRVGVFSLEMPEEQIAQRMIATESGIDMNRLRQGRLEDHEKGRFVEVIARLSELPVHIDTTPGLTPAQLRTKCRRLKHEHGLDVIVLDYVQLMHSGMNMKNNRVVELSYITRSLKELAIELDITILSGAQLSRAVEQREDKRPMLSDLRESGSIENDADIVMFIYRDEVYNPDTTEFPNQADIIIAKHRNGATGQAPLYFEKHLTKFSNATAHRIDLRDLQ